MPQPWVVSDFDDCQIVSASIPQKRKTTATKRPLSSLSQEFSEKVSTRNKPDVPDVPWSVRHTPKTVNELIIAKAKITELTNVLLNSSEPRVILLIGPPGCGKSTLIRCVARSLNLRVREWTQPSVERRSFVDIKGDVADYFDSGVCQSFSDFIVSSATFMSLGSSQSVDSGSITVIEDMPQFKSDSTPETMFHDLIRHCASVIRQPICFILTSNTANSDPPEMNRLFPQRLRDELNIYCLWLNPIPTRAMSKALASVAAAEKASHDISSDGIAEIVEGSEGDLRAAINTLQFLSQKKNQKKKVTETLKRGPKERRLTPETEKSIENSKNGNSSKTQAFNMNRFLQSDLDTKSSDSHSLLLFRAVGRVLYCKRVPKDQSENIRPSVAVLTGDNSLMLPKHLKELETDCLTFDPSALMRHCPVQPSTFVGFLHHNVPAFYSSIDDLAVLNEKYLSICDMILTQWDSPFDTSSELAGLLAIYGVVNCNSARRRYLEKDSDDLSQPTTRAGANHSASSFRPLYAPPALNSRLYASERQKAARAMLPDYLAAASNDVIADYISFARTNRNALSVRNSPKWLSGLAALADVYKAPKAASLSSTAVNFEEDVGSLPSQSPSIVANQTIATPPALNDEDAADCFEQNKLFLQQINDGDYD